MTTIEFSNEFDILYDSIASMGAPAIDLYEKSVFLTQGQLDLVKEYNSPFNKTKVSFEGSDKRRADLRELVVNYTIVPTKSTTGVSTDSYNAILPNDYFLMKYEAVFYTKEGCDDSIKIDVIPIKYDEYNDRIRNPFRKPDDKDGFRLDIASNSQGSKTVELIVSHVPDTYQIRYVKYPTPIVLTDLGGISSEPLSIDGVVVKTECTLDKEVHREILEKAVILAMKVYKPEALKYYYQQNQRKSIKIN